jgi:hypothetical protein
MATKLIVSNAPIVPTEAISCIDTQGGVVISNRFLMQLELVVDETQVEETLEM